MVELELSLVCGAEREQDCFQPAVCICRPGCSEQHACVVNHVLGGCAVSSAHAGPKAPVAWPETLSPVLMFLLLPSQGDLPRALLALFPFAIQIFIVGECLIQSGMDRKSPWLLALLILITLPFRGKGWYSLHQVTEHNSWYQHRDFYYDNHICITTCAITTLSSRSQSPPAGCQRQPTKGLWHPESADTPWGSRSHASWERIPWSWSAGSPRARRSHLGQTGDDAEQITGGTETSRNQHLPTPVMFLLSGMNCKCKNAARFTTPKQLLTTGLGVGSMGFFHILDHDRNTLKCGTALRTKVLCSAEFLSLQGEICLHYLWKHQFSRHPLMRRMNVKCHSAICQILPVFIRWSVK